VQDKILSINNSYSYDWLDRLISGANQNMSINYSYNAIGNIVTKDLKNKKGNYTLYYDYSGRAHSPAILICNGSICPSMIPTQLVFLSLSTGWNLVSIPMEGDISLIGDLPYVKIFSYDNELQRYYVPTNLSLQSAYWILMNKSINYGISSNSSYMYYVFLATGWNLLPYYGSNQKMSRVFDNATEIKGIYGYDLIWRSFPFTDWNVSSFDAFWAYSNSTTLIMWDRFEEDYFTGIRGGTIDEGPGGGFNRTGGSVG
jgi:hypothetical protein